MTSSSDDEFDDPYDYNEELEAEIQRLEKENVGSQHQHTSERDAITIAYELEAKPSTAGIEADASDMQPAPSQNSTFEEELVHQVTSLLNPAAEKTEDEISAATQPDIKVIPISVDEHGGVVEAIQIVQDDRSLFQRFRKREFFSVSDLVGPLWCEVQYDYRLRSKPYLKAEERPDVIITRQGKHILLDKVKAIDHDKTMKRGEVVHKKLEKEIHPVEVKVTTTSREDVWGLRFLNMLSSLQALLDIGKCRELPVVGFVRGYMVVGVIDELILEKLPMPDGKTSNSPERKSQRLLTSFFSSNPASQADSPVRKRTHRLLLSDSKTRASGTLPKADNASSGMTQLMCYKEILDSMLLASNSRRVSLAEGTSLQHSADSGASAGSQANPISVGRDSMEPEVTVTEKQTVDKDSLTDLQVDPEQPFDRFSWHLLFRHLHLDPNASLSDNFLAESRTVIYGNGLENCLYDSRCLWDYVDCWVDYVQRLGLGVPGAKGYPNRGKSEDRLELVYRNVRTSAHRKGKKRRSGQTDNPQQSGLSEGRADIPERLGSAPVESLQLQEEARLLALAIEESLNQTKLDELGLTAVGKPDSLQEPLEPGKISNEGAFSFSDNNHLALGQGEPVVAPPTAETVGADSTLASQIMEPIRVSESAIKPASLRMKDTKRKRPKDGSIIGSHVFHHDRNQLAKDLEGVLQFWMGIRQPEGVGIEHVSRCGWCEFEEGCEWRDRKAKEAIAKNRAHRKRG